ncbi:radical SAM protein [Roseivirga sp. BDSF3-8]|uniref:B12-binding domain-containing radical SAM protein n=1 Tax=Roseivirga sp. BDSF3-8 TaxID=3241598 RepID=UPI0035322542
MNKKLCLIRAPYLYKYANLDIAEEPILTYLMGYFKSIGFEKFYLFDFHLVRDTSLKDLLIDGITDYVIAVRETGENVHYVKRLCKNLTQATNANVYVYGHVARLKKMTGWPENVKFVHQSEIALAKEIGLDTTGATFGNGLTADPYFHTFSFSPSTAKRAKAALETTRGCHFPCSFCFINQGKNYDKRWSMRPNEDVLADIGYYYDLGIRSYVFYDSEFIGKNPDDYPQKKALLKEIIENYPGIKYKIYCRADTLTAFNEFALLKESGLVQVFVGAESLDQSDLDALNKNLSVEVTLECIDKLKEHDIYANLSFITFNRNTTISTLETNLEKITTLLIEKPRLIGVPGFTFAFESNWRPDKKRKEEDAKKNLLSGKTYVLHDLKQKEQPEDAEVFSAELEALMEIYRLLAYEWNKKLTKLNYSRDKSSTEELNQINDWFEGLSGFCLKIMKKYLYAFKANELNLDSLAFHSEKLFEEIADYYKVLPSHLQELETYTSHASTMSYSAQSERVEDDEYWLNNIPA